MIGFPVGVFVANGMEWYFYKVWLHEFPSKTEIALFSHILLTINVHV